MLPTRGRIAKVGRASTMMELGVGFHPDFTARENVYTGGIVSGLTWQEVHEAFPKIFEFAELEQYIDRPLRTFSTGMYMRLAFSLAIHIDPQILLIDEVLAVGDQSFQRKCMDRLYKVKDEGKTIVMVSLDVSMVANLCDRACWLENGRIRQKGDADEVVAAYLAETSSSNRSLSGPSLGRSQTKSSATLTLGVNRWGSLDVEIASVTLRDGSGAPRPTFEVGQGLEIEIAYRRRTAVREAIFQVALCREDGAKCLDVNTWADGTPAWELDDRGCITLSIDRLDLSEGAYLADVGVYGVDWAQIYDYHWRAYSFDVFSRSRHAWTRRSPSISRQLP